MWSQAFSIKHRWLMVSSTSNLNYNIKSLTSTFLTLVSHLISPCREKTIPGTACVFSAGELFNYSVLNPYISIDIQTQVMYCVSLSLFWIDLSSPIELISTLCKSFPGFDDQINTLPGHTALSCHFMLYIIRCDAWWVAFSPFSVIFY